MVAKKTEDFAFALMTDETEIKKAIKSINTRGKLLERDIHVAACSVLAKVREHNDIRLTRELFDNLTGSIRTNALRAWFENYGPVTFNKNKAEYKKREDMPSLSSAMAMPFWKFQPEPEYVPLDLNGAISKLLKRMEDDEEKVGTDYADARILLQALQAKLVKPLLSDAAQAPVEPVKQAA